MPELPDVDSYVDALRARTIGCRLVDVSIGSPFLLRTVEPPIERFIQRRVTSIRRIGKRIALGFDNDHWIVLHLMIAGRLHWHRQPPKTSRRRLAWFQFESGTISLTEAGTKRRASLHLVTGTAGLSELDPGGLEVLQSDSDAFADRVTRTNHTLKRALTDPRILSGIGNAYSDEILHAARLSPVRQTKTLAPDELTRLFDSSRSVLTHWKKLLAPTDDEFPEKVTAFREGMAVHGRYGQPCPDCGTAVQRIRYASNETNYCPRCQTDGRLLADRALSRLLKKDWPRSIDELERAQEARRASRATDDKR